MASDNSMLERIIDHIRKENLAPGDPIPSVRELSELWGIGRNLVHQGMIQAETLGLINVRPRSGAFVKMPDYSILADALVASLNPAVMFNEHATISHLNVARIAIETETAGQSAEKRNGDDLLAMQGVLRNFIDTAEKPNATRADYVDADEELHLGIARIAANPVLYNILKALLVLLKVQRISMVRNGSVVLSTTANRRTIDAHSAIYQAIRDGDADEARKMMKEHLMVTPDMVADNGS